MVQESTIRIFKESLGIYSGIIENLLASSYYIHGVYRNQPKGYKEHVAYRPGQWRPRSSPSSVYRKRRDLSGRPLVRSLPTCQVDSSILKYSSTGTTHQWELKQWSKRIRLADMQWRDEEEIAFRSMHGRFQVLRLTPCGRRSVQRDEAKLSGGSPVVDMRSWPSFPVTFLNACSSS